MQAIITQNKYCQLCNKKAESNMNRLTNYWYCNQCNLGWIKHIPKTLYQEEYYLSGSTFLSKLFSPLEYLFYKIRESYTLLTKKNVYIDVGAGDGNYLQTVSAKKKIGVEISSAGRLTMKKKGLTVMTNEEFLKKKNLNADVISFWHVLEHVTYPWDYIKAAKNNLKKSGKIVIAVPNVASFEFKLFKRHWFHLAPKYHIWHFSPSAIKIMLQDADLKVEKINHVAVEHNLAGVLQSFINATTDSENILQKLLKRREDLQTLQPNQIFFIFFWSTFGLPIIVLFWLFSALFQKSGTFVIVASKNIR